MRKKKVSTKRNKETSIKNVKNQQNNTWRMAWGRTPGSANNVLFLASYMMSSV